MELLQDRFLKNLNEKYGVWEKNSARFGHFSYGEIADDLCISGSQFSKLLYGTATNGMYERTIKNIERLKVKEQLHSKNKQLSSELDSLRNALSEESKSRSNHYGYYFLAALLAGILGFTFSNFLKKEEAAVIIEDAASKHFLADFFERDFSSEHISPFLNSGDAQAFCPCSAFEGGWALEKEYIIPVPMGKPGLYYLAKSSDMKMKCYRSVQPADKGKVLIGFEHMIHELWIDTKREPISPKYFDIDTKNYTKEFYKIDFEGTPSFKKVASIYSFMFNKFELKEEGIFREGEPVGRYAKEIDRNLANKYEIDVQDVMENIIGNLVKTVCEPALNEYCNPNKLIEGESNIKFDCDFTIKYENLGIGGSYPYTKSFKLMKQHYSDNLLCDCKN